MIKAWQNFKTRRKLNRLGQAQLRDLRMLDGVGGDRVIERLILTTTGICVLQPIHYPGVIFCADDIEQWTQLVDGKSYRFNNPLIELRHTIHDLQELVAGVPVDGYLLFDSKAEFPKGHPRQVIQLHAIPAALQRDKRAELPAEWLDVWASLARG